MKKNFIFKPRARLLLQLGDQLIKNENIALLELVKNSYDACATQVSVVMKKVDDPEEGMFIVEDDGTGMDMNLIENVWMEPGSDYKEKIYKQMTITECVQNKITEKCKRIPLGEKGIGRFSAHKLGNIIELVTRKKECKEIYLKIDWNVFGDSRYLDEVPVEIYEREPEVFTFDKTGTRITVHSLKRPWTRGMVRDIYRSLNSLCSPFDSRDSFRTNFEIDKKDWLEGLLSWEEITEYALFRFECEIEGQYIKKFRYKFTPWPAMKKLQSKEITEEDEKLKKLLKMADVNGEPIDLSKFKIGKVKFEGLIFDRETRILSLGVQDKKGLKDYLNRNGGIRVYRDGIRVYDYGEQENDWLSLGMRRINFPTKRISNNIIISAVSLNRIESDELHEKTNREGFIENEAYLTFKKAVLYALYIVETQRNIDKDQIRMFYGSTPRTEPVISGIEELKKIVEKKIKDNDLKEEIGNYLNRIEKDYRFINETLLRSAGAGLGLSVVIHEFEKVVDELNKVIEKEKVTDRIVSLVKHLSQLLEGYTLIIRRSEKKSWDPKKIIDQSIFNMEFRFRAHKIKIIKDYLNFNVGVKVEFARNLIVNTLMNIMDNSIWWFDYGGINEKKILISISEELPGFISIVIADNGPGFALPIEEITKPFVSAKPDGMGLGLHIANEVMQAHGGELIFPEWGDFTIPEEFKNGTIVALGFRKEVKK